MANKNILEEAVEDITALKKAAEENAKNYLIEAMSPRIKTLVEKHLGHEDYDTDGNPETGHAHNDVETMPAEESADMYEIDNVEDDGEGDQKNDDEPPEMHDGFEDGNDDDGDNVHINIKADGEDAQNEMTEDNDSDNESYPEESVEVTAEDLQKAFGNVLKNVRKEAMSFGKLGAEEDPNKGERGVNDKEKKDQFWDKGQRIEKDVKMHQAEALAKKVAELSEELKQYKEAFAYLKQNLQEMHLFNAKMTYANRLLQTNLSPKQKLSVVEAIDAASNKKEVELVYKTLSESFKIAGVVSEGKRTMKGPKASRITKPSSTLNEGADPHINAEIDRMAVLAGIVE